MAKGKKITLDIGLTNDLQIALFVRGDATEAEGKEALEQLIKALGTDDIVFKQFAEVEKHRDDTRTQLVHDMTHERNHRH